MDTLLRWILENKREFSRAVEAAHRDVRSPLAGCVPFVCRRGTLHSVLCTPYDRPNDWLVGATQHRGVVYLRAFDTEAWKEQFKRRTSDHSADHFTYWGYKFEQYMTSVNGYVVSLPRDRPKLVEDAIPGIFQGVPVYLSKPKERSHAPTPRPSAKRRRAVSSNCAEAEVAAVPTADVSDAAEEEIHDEVRIVNRLGGADAECLTEHAVCFASELQRVKAQLRSVKQQLHSCQRKLAKAEVQANEKRGMQETIQKLSGREMLIIDQCIMKANMKSPNSVR
ncbi:hypothetical protein HPB49_005746 [Dermacentor silvarum]|uniref:Uncharacterized protein n=1 Tax=Dermacentor silvarum TaxID=543639 RepID=A0ACB8C7F5_DERSI|nr:hypothetical protein HPB49_005746 [Dermacentor silvarum]